MGRRGNSRVRGDVVDGMLLLDKPAGATSNQALQRVKRLLNARKGGHTGSLDPIATGLLPLCFGETTKVSEVFLGADKAYWTRICLGVETDTGDREGRVVRRGRVNFSAEELEAAVDGFRGEVEQVPPMFSALKQGGQPLYKLARKGVEVEREARRVRVYGLEVVAWEGDVVELKLVCSRGFYVRSLARDLGEALGCGGHVAELRRTGVGGFSVEEGVTIEALEGMGMEERRGRLRDTEAGLEGVPRVEVSEVLVGYLVGGKAVKLEGVGEGWVRVYCARGFVGLGEVREGRVGLRRRFGVFRN